MTQTPPSFFRAIARIHKTKGNITYWDNALRMFKQNITK